MMDDLLYNIDGRATQKAVEDVLRQYRTYLLTTPEDMLPSITAKYTLEMPNYSNVKQSSVENAAVKMAGWEKERIRFFKWFRKGYSKLNLRESQIIYWGYLEKEPSYHYEIYQSLQMSESTYYRVRRRAILKLALGLGLEIYEESHPS